MLSTKSLLILRLNRICISRGITSLTTNPFIENNPNFAKTNGSKPSMSLNGICFRHLSDNKTTKAKSKPTMELSFVDDTPRLTHTQRLKRLIQNYGATAVVLHIAISLTSLGIWYSIIYFGVDVTQYVDFDRFGEIGAKVMVSSGTFAIAYTIHKMIMPFRIGATIVLTPVVVKWLRSKGIIKKPHKYI